MDIAITGSSGLIGRPLVARLTAEGHRVLRLVRPGAAHSPDAGSDTSEWDPATGTIDAAALEAIDAVIHLAGAGIADKRWTEDQKRLLRTSRTSGTGLLARTLAALDRPPSHLLSGSAIGYYGDTGDRATDESGPAGSDFLSGICVDWEAAAQPAIDAGIPTTFLRTGIVLSAAGGALGKQLLPFKLGLGGRVGSGRQYQSWISLDDELGAIGFLLEHPEVTGPVNLTSPNPVTNAEFTKTLGAVLHRPTTVIPLFAPRLLFGRELVDTLLLGSQRIIPRTLTDAGYPYAHPDLTEALEYLLG